MKILILGASGYIGSHLSETLAELGHEILRISRTSLDFDSTEALADLESLLSKERPRVVINAIGSIDQKVEGDPLNLIRAILLPTFGLFHFYSRSIGSVEVDIFILGSKSAGEPRTSYPLYAALKAAEVGLSKTAQETFSNSGIVWRLLTVPRLRGGLGVQRAREASLSTPPDKGLTALADTICQEISSLSL